MNNNQNTDAAFMYIAQVNPYDSLNILQKYGIVEDGSSPVTPEMIGGGLSTIVQENGQDALIDVMSIHPDKDIILELFGNSGTTAEVTVPPPPAPQSVPQMIHDGMFGNESKHEKSFLSSPTNVMILGVGIIAAIALLKSK